MVLLVVVVVVVMAIKQTDFRGNNDNSSNNDNNNNNIFKRSFKPTFYSHQKILPFDINFTEIELPLVLQQGKKNENFYFIFATKFSIDEDKCKMPCAV